MIERKIISETDEFEKSALQPGGTIRGDNKTLIPRQIIQGIGSGGHHLFIILTIHRLL
ncbi:MAG: hypothetical protein GXO92_08060 [FCB group bacterium]|nr:hypothetical protein [FCB group bacterium]